MTTRNQKLYKQMDELDAELKRNLIDQLEREASGKSSMFISRLMSSLFDGKTYQGPDANHIEDIAYKPKRIQTEETIIKQIEIT